ncbi:hypothetical protein IWQ60_012520 [Tieghemiomyces parasiticus]|uniref:Uncharacterized protein n=1 Tax=Tieghemiomyces parasiticus TaxID=78921 RepID=A0A9W7ZNJ3_9FUNG|nr:hypothetical protein IWQ60_012520 [Tieghemiomyces parasiticus]
MLHKDSVIPPSHLQFAELLANYKGWLVSIPIETPTNELTTGSAVLNNFSEWSRRRSSHQRGEGVINKHIDNLALVFDRSVTVALAYMGQVEALQQYLAKANQIEATSMRPQQLDELCVSAIVADRVKRFDKFIGALTKETVKLLMMNSCTMVGMMKHLGWEPNHRVLKSLITDCKTTSDIPHFHNDLPVYIGGDKELYFLTYDSMPAAGPTAAPQTE